ncbi:MAG: hypothetical protein KDD56_08025, partial [Bdellovibrionales bacterium]|nr:hypothetical protein [Bdellovibrionales bacterium]
MADFYMTKEFEQFGSNSGYIEELYRLYLTDPKLVGETWAKYFSSIENGSINNNGSEVNQYSQVTNGQQASSLTINNQNLSNQSQVTVDLELYALGVSLIDAYRAYGHFLANTNPLAQGIMEFPTVDELKKTALLDSMGSTLIPCLGFQRQTEMPATLLSEQLRKVYCGSIGIQFMHIPERERREWLTDKFENRFIDGAGFDTTARLRQLQKLLNAEDFEGLLHKRYVGHKR